MYIIDKNNVIAMTRGDYFKLKIKNTYGFPEKEWELGENDILYFGLMFPNQPFECAVLKRELTSDDYDEEGNLYLILNSDETIKLPAGEYKYEIKVLFFDEQHSRIETIVPRTKFIIEE